MADEYKLKVVIDDSQIKALESRLSKFSGGGSGGGMGGSSGSKQGGLAGLLSGLGGGDSKGMMKNIGKVAGIATGVLAIVGLAKKLVGMVVQSSPMLQQMLKLFNFGIMMILRPIGDFIGFALRPIMILMLTKFIIPFYQNMLPQMQKLGDWIGRTIVPIIEGLFNMLIGVGEFIVGKLTWQTDMADRGWARIVDTLGITTDAVNTGVHETINIGGKIEQSDKNVVKGIGDIIKSNVVGKMGQAMENFRSKAGSTEATQRIQDAFSRITNAGGRFGMERQIQKLGGGANAMMTVGAGQATMAARISNGDFKSVNEALKAYVSYLANSGKSTGLTDRSVAEAQQVQLVIEGNVYGMDDLDKHIEDVMQRTGARGTKI